MGKTVVGITMNLQPLAKVVLENLSDRIQLLELSGLVGLERKSGSPNPKLTSKLSQVEVLFMAGSPFDLPARMPKLRWLQWVGTGVDRLADSDLLGKHYQVTNAAGTNALPIAEHCIHFMLSFMKHGVKALCQQQSHLYNRDSVKPDYLEGKTLGVLGLGAIGREVARVGKAFNMRILATRRSADAIVKNVDDIDVLYPTTHLNVMLKECDFVVGALPLTPETHHFIGEEQLGSMKPSAYLINVGRGKHIDEQALIKALSNGQIAGAGLDVFETEPLPLNSQLWDMPNVIITPHVAGDLIDNRLRTTKFFATNLRRYLNGETLLNIVDPLKGY